MLQQCNMASSQVQTPFSFFDVPSPSEESVARISALPDPVNRNLQITACYRMLSAAFANRTGIVANWCTFATWASKQAGVTIRAEDLQRKLENALTTDPEVQEILSELIRHSKKLGEVTALHKSAIKKLVETVQKKASNAVARGNKKVFEEIGLQFARFMETCPAGNTYNESSVINFCNGLRPGDPPDGQEYLKKAFTLYYKAFFENDQKAKDELILLANILIGFHEQTRLQPEIRESLNAASVDPKEVKDYLTDLILERKNIRGKIMYFFSWILGKTGLFKKAVDTLVTAAERLMRMVITRHLMTLTLPPNKIIELSEDLIAPFPENLKTIKNTNVVEMLQRLRPTPDTIDGAGCKDWSELKERIHFIANLFRCYHETKDLFDDAFTADQLVVIESGGIPEGRL